MRSVLAWVLVGCSYAPERVANEDAPIDAFVPPACLTNPVYSAGGPAADHRYWVIDSVDYDTGVEMCARDGAHIVAIETQAENDFLRLLLGGNDAWIGFDDLVTEGTFRWVSGVPAAFVGFGGGEPNNNGNEDCTIFRTDSTWNDSSCNEQRRVVCECDPTYRAPSVRACRTMANPFRLKGRMYFPQQTAASWTAAAAFCESIDAYLAVPSDDGENSALEGRFSAPSWIGYSDLAVEGTFAWVDGSPTNYIHFELGQPSNGANENCVAFEFPNARWGDGDCATPRPYACECPPLH